LFRFRKEQKIFEVGKAKIGGQLGELPTVLTGSIFHEGHRMVKNENLGIFDNFELLSFQLYFLILFL